LALAPDTDTVKKLEPGKEPGKDDIRVTFENLEGYLGPHSDCRVYLGKVSSPEKPSAYWQVNRTERQHEANMQKIEVAVTVSISGDLRGPVKADVAGARLSTCVEPENYVRVILPVLINTRNIEASSELLIFKEPEKKEEKKVKDAQPIDALGDWKKRKAAQEEGLLKKGRGR